MHATVCLYSLIRRDLYNVKPGFSDLSKGEQSQSFKTGGVYTQVNFTFNTRHRDIIDKNNDNVIKYRKWAQFCLPYGLRQGQKVLNIERHLPRAPSI